MPVETPLPQTPDRTKSLRERRRVKIRLALARDEGSLFRLPATGRVVLGSREGVDLRLEDPYVSSRHAAIRIDADGARIEDLGSTNGTWVDGVLVRQAWLSVGARLRVGRHRLRVVAADSGLDAGYAGTSPMVGRSPVLLRVIAAARKLAPLRLPVLVAGETGTGKELVARALHEMGARRTGPFVAVNCAAIPEPLAESQLFGHVRGAFTGADRHHLGAFSRANSGTLFLDEVAELPVPLQAKLLRVLETGQINPVGSEREACVDVRVVSATHRPLDRMVAGGRMREDLFHRLSVFVVRVPALRERPEDIPLLIEHFLASAAKELGQEVGISRYAVQAAARHPWPGNVRALRNAILRAAALSDGPITTQDLLGPVPIATRSPAEDASALCVPRGDYASMQQHVLRQVVAEQGSIRRAARVLGVPRSTLGSWLKRGS
jgi:DNA-binding NtrC family response regulator